MKHVLNNHCLLGEGTQATNSHNEQNVDAYIRARLYGAHAPRVYHSGAKV